MLEDFLERLRIESDTLRAKHLALGMFIDGNDNFGRLDTEQQALMCLQRHHMGRYLMCLDRRYELLTLPKAPNA